MRIDAHQHFWKYAPAAYGWINDDMASLKRDFLPDDLAPLLAAAGLDGSVAVQARQSLTETDWLLSLADRYDWLKGVVGWVDLGAPDVASQLASRASHPKFRGVRHTLQDEPDDRYMLRPDFLRGLALLREFKLTYDILIHPRHLPIALDLVARFPDQPFVLDHIAKPFIKDGTLAPWAHDLRALATARNVLCKVSGMVTEAAWGTWKAADFKPYLDVVFECFEPDRLLFGSDWPVCTLSGNYAGVVALVRDYLQPSDTELGEKVFGGNAARFYGLTG